MFRDLYSPLIGTNMCSRNDEEYVAETKSICDDPPFRDRRIEALLRYRNPTEITVVMA